MNEVKYMELFEYEENIKFNIADCLGKGADSALPANKLASLYGFHERQITLMIEAERRNGTIICASSAGYFLPDSMEEVKMFIWSLEHREKEIRKTREAIEKAAETAVF